ncbi:MAG: glutathione synthase [Candidatus Omnitrophota bacterium]
MNFLFLMDPLETINVKKDTTFMLMLAAHKRGHAVYYLPDGGISLKNNLVYFRVLRVVPQRGTFLPFVRKETAELSQKQVDAVFIRTDPPFNEKYLMNTWLLDRLPKSIAVINRSAGVRAVNEKIWATQFANIIPRTYLGRNKQDILNFFLKEKKVIVKPVNGYGGSSVFYIESTDKNAHVIFETVSANWTKDIIVQQYISDAKSGDKRILLLNGEPLGAVLRVHASDDHRNNFFAGGKPQAATLTARDRQIIKMLKPFLKELGLYFVGIDIIGKYLIEVNVTSPTCLQEMNQLYDQNLEEKVIAFAEKLTKK